MTHLDVSDMPYVNAVLAGCKESPLDIFGTLDNTALHPSRNDS